MNVLIVSHQTPQDSGLIKTILDERGADVTIHMGYHDALPEIDPMAHDLAVFTGGPMGVYQADIFPYLNNELAYLERRLAADKPTLGICLGAQLMAQALGQKVYRGTNGKEIGWMEIDVLDKDSPARHFDAGAVRVMQWHGDTFDLPEGAKRLASSPQYANQIFSYGNNAIALQCHVEVTADLLEFWMAGGFGDLERAGIALSVFRAENKTRLPALEKQTRLFLNEWLAKVGL